MARIFKVQDTTKINQLITQQSVRIVNLDEKNGVYDTREAIQLAASMEKDLILVSETSDPPICKVQSYDKYLYEKKQKEKENRSKQKGNVLKEIGFKVNIADNDFQTKIRKIIEFLKEGSKVKTFVQFAGREIVFKDKGQIVLLNMIEQVAEFGIAEFVPKFEGKRFWTTLKPKK